jgi:DinB superfamily
MTNLFGPALAEALRRAFCGGDDAWFLAVEETLAALDADAAARTAPGVNAPWQVLDHLGTAYEVLGAAVASGTFDPAAFDEHEDWGPVTASSAAWQEALRRTRAREAAFRSLVAGLEDEDLLAPVAGLDRTRFDAIVDTIAHVAYHAGELATIPRS